MESSNKKSYLQEKFKKYRIEIRHILVIFVILVTFQIMLSLIQKASINNFLDDTRFWYQRDSAEEVANLTATSLELIIENIDFSSRMDRDRERKIIESFNIILNQQILQQNVEKVMAVFQKDSLLYFIDDGEDLLNYLSKNVFPPGMETDRHQQVRNIYLNNLETIKKLEVIHSQLDSSNTFNIFVPLIPRGEYAGTLFMRIHPDFSTITETLTSGYNEAAMINTSLIILGLLTMFYISSYTVKERDKAQELLMEEHEEHLKEQIEHEKEMIFTKRIYHSHHKAEKIIGFMREDLRNLVKENIDEIKFRLLKYSNFVSRVIYDMKWYEPQVSTFRGPFFNTNINTTLEFLIDHVFKRVAASRDSFNFILELDEKLPNVHLNEYVVWEIFEPIIQNSFDHRGDRKITVTIKTEFDQQARKGVVYIRDNGNGIREDLLIENEDGIKALFLENISTRKSSNRNTGYGCFIAYNLAKNRCGWDLDAYKNENGGATFKFMINF